MIQYDNKLILCNIRRLFNLSLWCSSQKDSSILFIRTRIYPSEDPWSQQWTNLPTKEWFRMTFAFFPITFTLGTYHSSSSCSFPLDYLLSKPTNAPLQWECKFTHKYVVLLYASRNLDTNLLLVTLLPLPSF